MKLNEVFRWMFKILLVQKRSSYVYFCIIQVFKYETFSIWIAKPVEELNAEFTVMLRGDQTLPVVGTALTRLEKELFQLAVKNRETFLTELNKKSMDET